MEQIVKHFSELSQDELFEIYKIRTAIFVVEQECPYQEVDEADRTAWHVWLKDENGIAAYARVLPKGIAFDEVSIGRVLVAREKRRQGLGRQIMKAAIQIAKEKFHAEQITIMAQCQAEDFYKKLGFVQISEAFPDVNIMHIRMQLTL